MAASVSAGSATNDHGLAALPARPPTPPKEAQQNSASARPSIHRSVSEIQQQTPPGAILESPAGTQTTEGRRRKRVEWSGRTEYKEPERYIDGHFSAKSSPLLGSSSRLKPVKGILKISSSPAQPSASQLSARLDASGDAINIPEMLDSSIKQLAGADRDSKVDAYMTLARALKASNNLPDRVALQGKMSILTHFIQRDITLKPVDRSLANHALNLLLTFLHFNAIASTIPHDFAVFIVDHAIRTFEDPSMTKETVRYLMQVIAFQSFSGKVMSHDRVGRLLAAVHGIEDSLMGKSLVMSRIKLYKRLIKQCPNSMAGHNSWMQDMFPDMLSLTKDIRDEAISLGFEAGFSLRHDKQVQRNAMEVLETTLNDKSFIESYIESLAAILDEKDRARSSAVPQIWTVVNLFLKCPPERWELYAPWLRVAQSAFNCADVDTKLHANLAWSRYVYLSLCDTKLTAKSLSMMCQPILSQLRNKATKKVEDAAKLRRAVIGGACNLFYYALRPNTDKYSPDMIWDVAVLPLIARIITLEGPSTIPGDWTNEAAKVLNGLLDGTTPRVWREDRIRNPTIVKADELPPIDAKWIRKHSAKVFEALTPLMERKIADLAQPSTAMHKLWASFVGAIAAASAKDIKISEDTVKFLAGALGCLCRVWSYEPSWIANNEGARRCLDGVNVMVQTMVTGLGVLPFTQQKLAMTAHKNFEPTTQSSRQGTKPRGVVRTPMLHVVNLFCTLPSGVNDDQGYTNFLEAVLDPFFAGKSEKVLLALARDMLNSLPGPAFCPIGIWRLASSFLRCPLTRTLSEEVTAQDNILGPEYREMVTLLERAITSLSNLPSADLIDLFDLIDRHAEHHFGQAGRVLVLLEPVAKSVAESISDGMPQQELQRTVLLVTRLLSAAHFPKDRQAMDSARRHLWGAAPATNPQGPFNPFDHLFRAAQSTLTAAHANLRPDVDMHAVAELLGATAKFCERSPLQHANTILAALSSGVMSWIRDSTESLKTASSPAVAEGVNRLWVRVCIMIKATVGSNSLDNSLAETLLSAGLDSALPKVVEVAIHTYGELLEHGELVTLSLKSRMASTALQFEAEPKTAGDSSTGDIQQAGAGQKTKLKPHATLSSPRPPNLFPNANTPSPVGMASRYAGRPDSVIRGTPTPAKTRSAKKSTPRLRHDNSQIEFTPIAASSPQLGESQHLTERQKEVRARQDNEAAIYEQAKKDSPGRSGTPVPSPGTSLEAKQKTPERPTKYGELVSSTPTPRRGQLLAIDFNDPPSSPPEPRPYPLQAEIESRSRVSESMEWEFSSPVSSPVKGDKAVEMVTSSPEEPDEDITESLTVHVPDQLGPPSGDRQRSSSDMHAVPPQPLSTLENSEQSLGSPLVVPTPPSRRSKRQRKASQAKKEAELAEQSRTPATRSGRASKRTQGQSQEAVAESQGDSFALSEGDESKMMQLIVEAESRSRNSNAVVVALPAQASLVMQHSHEPEESKAVAPEERPGSVKEKEAEVVHDEIEVTSASEVEGQGNLMPSSPTSRRKRAKARTEKDPCSQSSEKATRSASRKASEVKRKAADWRADFGRNKRRKESNAKEEDLVSVSDADGNVRPDSLSSQSQSHSKKRRGQRRNGEPELASLPSPRRSTRRKKRGPKIKKEPVEEDEEVEAQAEAELPSESVDEIEKSEDTDEELLSQLLADSTAASQSQPQPPEDDPTVAFTDIGLEDTVLGPADEAMHEAPEEPADPAVAVLQNLRTGLDLLQTAKMTPEQVSEMETLILDLKREMYQAEYRGRNSGR